MGEFPEQSGIYLPIFTQAQSGQCHSKELTLFDTVLSGPDSVSRRGVPGLCSCRGPNQNRSFGNAELAHAGSRMVQPCDRSDDLSESDYCRVVLPFVQSSIQRRCGALCGGHCGPQVENAMTVFSVGIELQRQVRAETAMPVLSVASASSFPRLSGLGGVRRWRQLSDSKMLYPTRSVLTLTRSVSEASQPISSLTLRVSISPRCNVSGWAARSITMSRAPCKT